MALQLDDLALLDAPQPGSAAGEPMSLSIESIDEDPLQPRIEFDPEPLQQLADTIAQRGVRQPISVRPHPEQPGRWMLNVGARRLRASKLAGHTVIPGFVDALADSYDQVMENEQREGLKPLELALFVQRRMAAGESQAEIARRLGKTRGYVTFVCALVEAPQWLLDLYRSGRCRGITELYELRRLHEVEPDAVERWLATQSQVGRADVQALKDGLKHVVSAPPAPATLAAPVPPSASIGRSTSPQSAVEPPMGDRLRPANAAPSPATSAPSPAARGAARVTLWGCYEGAEVRIDLRAVPDEDGCVFVLRDGSGDRFAVAASRVQLRRITDA